MQADWIVKIMFNMSVRTRVDDLIDAAINNIEAGKDR